MILQLPSPQPAGMRDQLPRLQPEPELNPVRTVAFADGASRELPERHVAVPLDHPGRVNLVPQPADRAVQRDVMPADPGQQTAAAKHGGMLARPR